MSFDQKTRKNTMRKFLVLAMLATIVVFMLVQFGPAVVFSEAPAPSSHVRIGIR
jgi:hypothetical protein